MAHELGLGQWMRYRGGDPGGWAEVPPGIPSSDVQNGEYNPGAALSDPWNISHQDDTWPDRSVYPVLFRYHDSWNVTDEFSISVMARQAASLVPLLVPGG
jgi:hypothetical protein